MTKRATIDDLGDILNCYLQYYLNSDEEFVGGNDKIKRFLSHHILNGHCYWDYGVVWIAVPVIERGLGVFDEDAMVGDMTIVSTLNSTNDSTNMDKLMSDIYEEYPNATFWGKTKKTNSKMIARFERKDRFNIHKRESGDSLIYYWNMNDKITNENVA